MVVDDTTAQLRTRLASSSAVSQVNLGYLIAQSPTSAQRGAYRGLGFEMRSDAWNSVRGGDGLLLSTTLREQAGTSVRSTQMDVAEAVAQMKGAHQLDQSLLDAARQQTALASNVASRVNPVLSRAIDPKEQGKHPATVNGHPSQKSRAGNRDLDSNQPVERFADPVVMIESPTSINFASPSSSAFFAGEDLHWTSQADLHLTAKETLSSVSGNALSWFTHGGGAQLIAANGPVSLQAHTDKLELLADKAITVISVNEGIEIKAQQKIQLQAGQAATTLEGGDITFACPGTFSVKGAVHPFSGGKSSSVSISNLPDSRIKLFDEAFILRNERNGKPICNYPYRIKLPDGTFEYGRTDDNGRTHIVKTTGIVNIILEVL